MTHTVQRGLVAILVAPGGNSPHIVDVLTENFGEGAMEMTCTQTRCGCRWTDQWATLLGPIREDEARVRVPGICANCRRTKGRQPL